MVLHSHVININNGGNLEVYRPSREALLHLPIGTRPLFLCKKYHMLKCENIEERVYVTIAKKIEIQLIDVNFQTLSNTRG
jgi:hypothetical protein